MNWELKENHSVAVDLGQVSHPCGLHLKCFQTSVTALQGPGWGGFWPSVTWSLCSGQELMSHSVFVCAVQDLLTCPSSFEAIIMLQDNRREAFVQLHRFPE